MNACSLSDFLQTLINLLRGQAPSQTSISGKWEIKLRNPTKVITVNQLTHGQTIFKSTRAKTSPPLTFDAFTKYSVASDPVTGGFTSPLSFSISYGTRVDKVQTGKNSQLINNNNSRLNAYKSASPGVPDPTIKTILKQAATSITEDLYVYHVMEKFLSKDGYSINAYDNYVTCQGQATDGCYDPTKTPPEININVNSVRGAENTLAHELMHYVFDRVNSSLSIQNNPITSHVIMNALFTKCMILDKIRNSKLPNNLEFYVHDKVYTWDVVESVNVNNGSDKYTIELDLRNEFESLLKDNPSLLNSNDIVKRRKYYDNMRSFFQDDKYRFKESIISLSLIPAMVPYKIDSNPPSTPIFTNDEFKDLIFIYAQNAEIISQAYIELINCYEKEKLNGKEAKKKLPNDFLDMYFNPFYNTGRKTMWSDAMKVFINNFIKNLEQSPVITI